MAQPRTYKIIELETIEGNKLPRSFLEAKHIIESFNVRNNDIWLTSFPKSGTTWAQELIWLVANDLDYGGAKQTIEHRFPFFEYSAIKGKGREQFLIDNNLKSNFPNCAPVVEYMKKFDTSNRRFIKTHLNWDLLPKQIKDGSKTPKIIHILRDPKQVAVSYYHHATKVFPWFVGELTDFVELFMKGEVLFGDYFNNILPFWQRKSLPNMLIITYEDMKQDLKSVIKKVADFLGKSLNEDEMHNLEVHLSFDQMKSNTAVNKQHLIKNKNVEFLRKGTVDSFKEELNEDVIQKLNEWVQENAEGRGLPYEININDLNMHSSTQYKSADLANIDGIYKPSQFLVYKDRIENFEVKDDDIWVTSYPKAGTTWCQELVWLLANDLNYEAAKVDLEKRFPFLEYQSTRDTIEIFLKRIGNTDEVPTGIDVIKLLDQDKNQRFIKSHLPWNLLPTQIKNGSKTPKIIHIMRNPKQCAVSYYHHSTKMFPSFIGSINEYIDLFIQGKVFGGCYFKVVLSYWNRRHLSNVLILTYEEMKSDLDTVIERVCKFLGKTYSIEDIEKLKHHLDFKQMKINPAVNKSRIINIVGAEFLREGSCHGYKRELSQELMQKIDVWVKQNLKGSGIPYESDFDYIV